ncbi:E3 ubiquitin-protein ligase RNF6 isoform X3 [Pipistrellus kuhlii]|uniref:E3 ubiquitin-protein ligase RNF6 isoform X3 n=1 Tax=Pipistrellus kuhlii TaxID=59472 RepID=UPI001E27443C|nr:E3 ubiquitin-protein ligase RNF6 isoform X3 [Pipistrellus kuhlii]
MERRRCSWDPAAAVSAQRPGARPPQGGGPGTPSAMLNAGVEGGTRQAGLRDRAGRSSQEHSRAPPGHVGGEPGRGGGRLGPAVPPPHPPSKDPSQAAAPASVEIRGRGGRPGQAPAASRSQPPGPERKTTCQGLSSGQGHSAPAAGGKARNLRMNQSRSTSDDGGEETLFQDHDHPENERRWQQERLHREEAYYQFISELSDEDYRLMRDHNLLGTPGEITSEELQQRLNGVKEQPASRPDFRNGTNTRERDRAHRGTAHTPFSSSRLVSRITVEEREESNRSSSAARHPTITLDLQVRRMRPGENRDRDSIANRTRSRVGLAENAVTIESNSGGFRRTISRLERSGVRTYVSTITVPLRRISENELVEPSSLALRSILRQIMTGFGELSSLMEAESESEIQRNGQRLPEMDSELSNLVNDISQHHEDSSQDRWAQEDNTEMSGEDETTQPHNQNSDSRRGRLLQNSNNLVETGTLPILRLAHFFLLNESDDDDRIHGLTKEQIDNLSTRNYEHNSIDNELGKICSVCISDYVTGNKLRQLPCMHEFHIHCIDRWLSENCTCPVCRHPVLGSSIVYNG